MAAAIRVRIEYEDGTYRELVGRDACNRWQEMVSAQASLAFAHGYNGLSLPWRGSAEQTYEGNPPSDP